MDLLIIGASARAAAQSARRAGFTPHAIDLFGDEDLRAVADQVEVIPFADYPQELPAIAQKFPPMPWMYVGGLEGHLPTLDCLTAQRPLLGVDGFVLRKMRNQETLRTISEPSGLTLPDTRRSLSSSDEPSKFLLKSMNSSGGLRVSSGTAASFPLADDEYLQEFVPGESLSAAFVADGKESRLLGLTQQLIGKDYGAPKPFQYTGNIGPLQAEPALSAKVQQLGSDLVKAFELRGLYGVDIKVTAMLEVNPRYTSGMEVLERSGVVANMVALHVIACLGRLPDEREIHRSPATMTGKLIIYAPAAGQLPSDWPAGVECPPGVTWADIPPANQHFAAGDPVVTALCQRGTAEEVLRTLLAAREALVACWRPSAPPGTSHASQQ